MSEMRESRGEIGTAVHRHDERPSDGTAAQRSHCIVEAALIFGQRIALDHRESAQVHSSLACVAG
jgi:hypothetical protein